MEFSHLLWGHLRKTCGDSSPSKKRESLYFNHKKTFSIVLMAEVDFNICFTFVEVGQPGSENDAGVFNNGPLWLALENGILPDGLVLVGDDVFPLKPYLMKPYSPTGGVLAQEQRICNYRFSRARRISENAFGILVSRFRVFEGKILCNVSTVRKVVKDSCTLHNWLRKTSSTTYCPPGSVDKEVEIVVTFYPDKGGKKLVNSGGWNDLVEDEQQNWRKGFGITWRPTLTMKAQWSGKTRLFNGE